MRVVVEREFEGVGGAELGGESDEVDESRGRQLDGQPPRRHRDHPHCPAQERRRALKIVLFAIRWKTRLSRLISCRPWGRSLS